MHALDCAGYRWIDQQGRACVWGFFILSGCVLARSYDGRFGLFLVRRVIRLWPVHLVCLALAWKLLGAPVTLADLFLFPWGISAYPGVFVLHLANPPTWSLCIEVGAALFMPAIAWCGRKGILGFFVGMSGSIVLGMWVYPPCLLLAFFVLGAAFSQVRRLSFWPLETRLPRWLGKISYSLYLVHAPVLGLAATLFGAKGPLYCFPAAIGMAWIVWKLVENPSASLARRVRSVSRPRAGALPRDWSRVFNVATVKN